MEAVLQSGKATLKNKKGLTLIELLAILVIVGIIAAIAIPAINSTIDRSKTKADTATQELIKDAAMRYALENNLTAGETVNVSKLVSDGYLNDTPTFNKDTNKKQSAAITITSGKITITLNTDAVSTP